MNPHYYQSEFVKDGVSLSKSSKKGYPRHFHLHIELLCLLSGSYVAIVDDTEYRLYPGDLLIIFPYQMHEYLDISGNNYEAVIKVDPEILKDYKTVFEQKYPRSAVLRSADMTEECKAAVNWLIKTHHSEQDVTLLRKSLINTLMWYFTNETEFNEIPKTSLQSFREIIQYCNEHYLEPSFSLQTICNALGLSYAYVSRVISQKLNIPFSEYINQLRIHHAIKLLCDTEDSVTNIALSCGYNTIRNFNDKFVKCTGKTPSEYRRAHREHAKK